MSAQQQLLKVLFACIWLLTISHVTAEYYYLYWTYRWLDIPMHFFGGVWVGLAGVWAVRYAGYVRTTWLAHRNSIVVALVSGLLLGLVWELYEYVVWQLTGVGLPLRYVPDTTLDILMDVTGAFISGTGVHVWELRSQYKTNENNVR